jgi:hypothetical protein
MANTQEGIEKAKLTRLKKKADKLGIPYHESIDLDTLQLAVDEYEEAMAADAPAGADTASAVAIGKAIAQEMGTVMRRVMQPTDPTDGLIDERDADPNDAAPLKSYFTPQFWWKLPAKRIGGQLVKAPYGKILFKMSSGDAVRNGDQWNTKYISIYNSVSKKEQAYIETHELFGKTFFPNIADAQVSSEQIKFAQCFNKHYQALATKMAPELYREAAALGANLSKDMALNTIRTTIAEVRATRELANLEAQRKEVFANTGRASLLRAQQNAEKEATLDAE